MKKFIQKIISPFIKPEVKQTSTSVKSKNNYVDPITGGADMIIIFEKYDDAKWFTTQIPKGMFGSWFDRGIYFFRKDLEVVKTILSNKDVAHTIRNTQYISVNEAIERTISSLNKK